MSSSELLNALKDIIDTVKPVMRPFKGTVKYGHQCRFDHIWFDCRPPLEDVLPIKARMSVEGQAHNLN